MCEPTLRGVVALFIAAAVVRRVESSVRGAYGSTSTLHSPAEEPRHICHVDAAGKPNGGDDAVPVAGELVRERDLRDGCAGPSNEGG